MSLTHLGIIADGNRRWAEKNGLPKIEGHTQGLKTIEKLVAAAAMAKIPYVSFYVFSTENWGREEKEVSHIMKLAESKILKMAEKMAENNIRLLILGSRGKVNPTLTSLGEKAEKITENCTGTTVCFCFNYGGEQEIASPIIYLNMSVNVTHGIHSHQPFAVGLWLYYIRASVQ